MTTYIVVEGEADVEIVKRLLPENVLPSVTFVPAGGAYAVKSLAVSLMVRRQEPVVVLVDSDSLSAEIVAERRQGIEETMGSFSARTPYAVIVAVPSLETVFFKEAALLPKLLGIDSIPETLRIESEFQPKQALDKLLKGSWKDKSLQELLVRLTVDDLEALRKYEPIRELIGFLEAVESRFTRLKAA